MVFAAFPVRIFEIQRMSSLATVRRDSKVKKVLTFIIAAGLLLISGTSVLSGNTNKAEPVPYTVVCKDTKTGTVQENTYNTELTVAAKNEGLSGLTSPAFEGNLQQGYAPESFNYIHNRVPTKTKQFPYRAVCFVQAFFDTDKDGDIDDNDTSLQGSGFLIGPSTIATCGHLLYSREYGWSHHVEVSPAKNGEYAPYMASSIRVHIAEKWISGFNENFDWGVVELDFNYGKYLGWYGKHWRNWSLAGESVNVTGYPNDKQAFQWRSPGTIAQSDEHMLDYGCDIMVGVSGGPVYSQDNIVYGINTYKTDTESGGVKITEELYCFFDRFK